MEKPKVLIIEDQKRAHLEYEYGLRNLVQILSAFTIEEGRKIYKENPDLWLIVMDACVPGGDPNTLDLTREIRKSFIGRPMIAASMSEKFQDLLIEAGCDHKADKSQVVDKIKELLKL